MSTQAASAAGSGARTVVTVVAADTYISSALTEPVTAYLPAGSEMSDGDQIIFECTGGSLMVIETEQRRHVGVVPGDGQALCTYEPGNESADFWRFTILSKAPGATIADEAAGTGPSTSLTTPADLSLPDGVIGGDFTVAAQAGVTLLGAGYIRWRRAGIEYSQLMDTSIPLTAVDVLDDNKWRAYRLEISDLGAVTAVSDGDTQHDSEEEALIGLGTKAVTASTVEIGYFVIESDGGFTPGTHNTNGESNETIYILREPRAQAMELTAAMSVDLSEGTNTDEWAYGTVDGKRSGIKQAQIPLDTTIPFSDSDTIDQGKFGGMLFVGNLAQDDAISISAGGDFGAVEAQAYDNAAAVQTALDALEAQIPAIFPILGSVVITNNLGGVFTFNTDDVAGTDGSAVWESRAPATGGDSVMELIISKLAEIIDAHVTDISALVVDDAAGVTDFDSLKTKLNSILAMLEDRGFVKAE